MRWKVLRSLTKEWQHTAKIAQVADLPPRSAKYHLDEIVALKLAEKLLKDEADSSMDHRFDYFKLSDLSSDVLKLATHSTTTTSTSGPLLTLWPDPTPEAPILTQPISLNSDATVTSVLDRASAAIL